MQPVELTYSRALKVWWSFLWRTWLIMIPVSFILIIVMLVALWLTGSFAALSHPEPGKMPFGGGFIALTYLIFLPAMLFVNAYTMQLALKVKWSDFQLVAVGSAPAASAVSQTPTT